MAWSLRSRILGVLTGILALGGLPASGEAGAEVALGQWRVISLEGAGVFTQALAGPAENTAALVAALHGLDGREAALEIAGGVLTVASLTVPPAVRLKFGPGGVVDVAEGETLRIEGEIEGPPRALFQGAGRVEGAPRNITVLPQWFGARGDGRHDDGPALRQAADLAAGALGRTLFIPKGDYRFEGDLVFRCNIESRGRFIKEMEVDESRTAFSNDLFLPTHYLKSDPQIRFEPDHPAETLDAEPFLGIREGDLSVPVFRDVPRADGGGTVTLEEGGTLRFYSSDFFSSRSVRKGDHFYDRNDITQLVSGRGEVFPEFAFDYLAPPEAEPWSAARVYGKGDYCVAEGEVFKATWASGPGTDYTHRHFGRVDIGPVPPVPGQDATSHAYTYADADGTRDSIGIWRRVWTEVHYQPKDTPLTVNGLRMELRLLNHGGEVKRIEGGAMTVSRSNMTFNNLEITVRDPEATLSRLLQVSSCVNHTFNNGYFSGATSAHLGYNILNSNVANVRYNHCISTNSRKGMDGRHGKNITINGGCYNVINDHYGRNYIIRDITLTGLSVFVPGDSTPSADLQNWRFGQRGTLSFNGANFHIENITVVDGSGGILGARGDIGDLYGDIVLRDVSVRGNSPVIRVFEHSISSQFDYAHEVRVPRRLTIENVRAGRDTRLDFTFGAGFEEAPYGPVNVRDIESIGHVHAAGPVTRFSGCEFNDTRFARGPQGDFQFVDCTFAGDILGLDPLPGQEEDSAPTPE
jgi:hypothetical protein